MHNKHFFNVLLLGERWDKKTVGVILIGVKILALVKYLVFYWYSSKYNLLIVATAFIVTNLHSYRTKKLWNNTTSTTVPFYPCFNIQKRLRT